MTVPFALRFPKICDGLAPPIWLMAMELTEGWMNVVVSPRWMLKLLQFKNADWLVVTFNCEPFCCVVAEPDTTVRPVGFANRKLFPAKSSATASEIFLNRNFMVAFR